jgi:hypothetical protein
VNFQRDDPGAAAFDADFKREVARFEREGHRHAGQAVAGEYFQRGAVALMPSGSTRYSQRGF